LAQHVVKNPQEGIEAFETALKIFQQKYLLKEPLDYEYPSISVSSGFSLFFIPLHIKHAFKKFSLNLTLFLTGRSTSNFGDSQWR
jgi:hypothetical protein